MKRHDFFQTPLYNSGVARFESWTISHTFTPTKMATETVKGPPVVFRSYTIYERPKAPSERRAEQGASPPPTGLFVRVDRSPIAINYYRSPWYDPHLLSLIPEYQVSAIFVKNKHETPAEEATIRYSVKFLEASYHLETNCISRALFVSIPDARVQKGMLPSVTY